MRVSCIVLTRGDRPVELVRCLDSVRGQAGVELETVLVGNGCTVDAGAADVVLSLPENLGVAEGRNRGAAAASGDVLWFLDDDARVEAPDLAAATAAAFGDPAVAVVAMRVVDERGRTQREHLPRIGTASADRPGAVTSFLGGACAIRRTAFERLGGLPGPFFYALEETDFAWRAIDAGWSVVYRPELRVVHPHAESRLKHPSFHTSTARNRVWLAHRNLPGPLAAVYVLDWLLITVARSWRRPADIRAAVAGTRVGVRAPLGPRRPMAWRTVWRLARLGRPPLL